MRIDTIAIDGFGQFHGTQLEPAPGLTVVRGPNEAGKTTLLAFTRAMLFGFETHKYPAFNGGKRGGWLEVVMADGRELRIERYGDRGGDGKLRVIEADNDLGPGQLSALLQGVESTVYQNIFAFGLEELTRFQTLKDDEVAARIYGAGLGTGGVSGLKVEQALRDRMEDWFKSGGSKPRINLLLGRLEDLDRELADRDLPREYAEAGSQLDAIRQQLAEAGARHAELDTEQRRLQRLIDGWETWLELRRAQQERDALGEVRTFEGTVLEQLVALEASHAEAQRAHEVAARDVEQAEARLEAAAVDEPTLARRDELEALAEATKIEVARVDERARTERALTQACTAVEGAVTNLGGDWTIERVEAFDDSIAVKSEISGRFRTLLEAADRAVADARSNHEAAEEQSKDASARAKAADARVTELQEELAGRPPSAARERRLREIEDLTAHLAGQRRIAADAPEGDLEARRSSLEERRSKARELADALRTQRDARDMLPNATAMAESADSQAQRQYLMPVAIGIGGVVLAVVLAALEASLAVVVIAAAAGVGGGVAWGVVVRMQGPVDGGAAKERLEKQITEATATIERIGPELGSSGSVELTEVERYQDGLDGERHELEKDQDRLEKSQSAALEVERLERTLADVASGAGLPKEPTPADLGAFGQAIAEDRETEARRAEAIERKTQLQTATETQTRRVAELAATLEKRAEEADTARAEWADWLEEHGLDRDLDRETAARVVESVTSAKGAVARLRTAEGRSKELAKEHAEYVERVQALSPLLADGDADEADVAATATLLAKRLADALKGERDRDDLERAVEEKRLALTAARESREAADTALDAFFTETDVHDAMTLRTEVDRSRSAAELDAAVAAARVTLTTLSGPDKALEGLIADLDAVVDIAEVSAAVAAIASEMAELDAQRDEFNQVAGGLATSRQEMETDAAATELRQERADLISQLGAAAERWTVFALARQILNRSRTVYEEAHRPAVIEKAEHFFEAWTDGRYQRIIAPLGEDIRGVKRSDGGEVEITELSRGTSEQLYLALRFGLVQHFVETSGEPLPIVMDDILVNFDDQRAARAARSIEELSRTCQIVYFTCHPTTPLKADLERELKPIPMS